MLREQLRKEKDPEEREKLQQLLTKMVSRRICNNDSVLHEIANVIDYIRSHRSHLQRKQKESSN